MNESCHIWMSHVTYEWVMSHMNESCHTQHVRRWAEHEFFCGQCRGSQVKFLQKFSWIPNLLHEMAVELTFGNANSRERSSFLTDTSLRDQQRRANRYVCCSVLQCVAVCCSVCCFSSAVPTGTCVAMCCSVCCVSSAVPTRTCIVECCRCFASVAPMTSRYVCMCG